MLWLKIILVLGGMTLLGFLFITLIPLRFHMYYEKQAEDDDFVVEIQPPKNIMYHKLVIPMIKLRDHWRKVIFEWEGELGNEQELFEEGKAEVNLVEEYQLIMGTMQRLKEHALSCGYLARYIKLHRFKLTVKVGTGNPAYTGMITGLLWGTVPPISARIINSIQFIEEKPIIEITPDFTRKNFAVTLDSIFTLKIGHIITISSCVLMQEIKRYLRRKRKLGKKEVTE